MPCLNPALFQRPRSPHCAGTARAACAQTLRAPSISEGQGANAGTFRGTFREAEGGGETPGPLMPPSGPTPQATCESRGSPRLRDWQEVTGHCCGVGGMPSSPPLGLWSARCPTLGSVPLAIQARGRRLSPPSPRQGMWSGTPGSLFLGLLTFPHVAA